jgi:hypothetical protein
MSLHYVTEENARAGDRAGNRQFTHDQERDNKPPRFTENWQEHRMGGGRGGDKGGGGGPYGARWERARDDRPVGGGGGGGKGGFDRGRHDRDGERGGDRGGFDHRRDDRIGWVGGGGDRGGYDHLSPRHVDDRGPPRRDDNRHSPRRDDDRGPPRRDEDRPPPRRADDRGPPREEPDAHFDELLAKLKLAYSENKLGTIGGNPTKIVNQFENGMSHCKHPDAKALVERALRLRLHVRLATALSAWNKAESEASTWGAGSDEEDDGSTA